nr:hypothetical protein [uncultured Rhodopila sp.]
MATLPAIPSLDPATELGNLLAPQEAALLKAILADPQKARLLLQTLTQTQGVIAGPVGTLAEQAEADAINALPRATP